MSNKEPQGESLGVKPNIKPLSEWSDEELKTKVAELCGWNINNGHLAKGTMPFLYVGTNVRTWAQLDHHDLLALPDYPSDLNAMHEALCTLKSDGSWGRYRTYLERLINTLGQPSNTAWFLEHNATARQRAEAFVATLTNVQTKSSLATQPLDGHSAPKAKPSELVNTEKEKG